MFFFNILVYWYILKVPGLIKEEQGAKIFQDNFKIGKFWI